jgi:hypothetical protein
MMLKETIVGPWVVEQSGNVDRKNVCVAEYWEHMLTTYIDLMCEIVPAYFEKSDRVDGIITVFAMFLRNTVHTERCSLKES